LHRDSETLVKDYGNNNLRSYLAKNSAILSSDNLVKTGDAEKDVQIVKVINSMLEEIQDDIDSRDEETSEQAMMVTEAIYKFTRRNTRLQHLDLTHCNLSQVMIGRIGLGVKCSKSLLSVHFSDNPGVTGEVRSFLRYKFKAHLQEENTSGVTTAFIDQGQ
jgi:hypothetical protein